MVATGLALTAVALPAAWLFAGLLVGGAVSLGRGRAPRMPEALFGAAQAVAGVALGAFLQPAELELIAARWPAVLAVTGGTLAVSLVIGLALARLAGLDRVTATLGMVPGALPGVVALGDETGADTRLVSLMQLARIGLVLLTVPVAAGLLGSSPADAGGSVPVRAPGPASLLLVAVAAAGGAAVGRALRLPAGTLIGPLLLSAIASGLGLPMVPPGAVTDAAFAGVGLDIGLRFERAALGRAARAAPAVAAAVAVLVASSAALAVVLAKALEVGALTAYLATTPGGISTVALTALDTGANVTAVLAVQELRLLLLTAGAGIVVGVVRTRRRSRGREKAGSGGPRAQKGSGLRRPRG